MITVAVLNPSGVSHTPDILTQGGGRAGIRLSPGEGDVATHTRTHTSFALVTAMHGTGQPFPAGTSPLSQKGALQEGSWCKLKHKHPFSIMTGDYLQKGINTQFFLKIHASPSGKDKVIQTLARSLLRLQLPPAPQSSPSPEVRVLTEPVKSCLDQSQGPQLAVKSPIPGLSSEEPEIRR